MSTLVVYADATPGRVESHSYASFHAARSGDVLIAYSLTISLYVGGYFEAAQTSGYWDYEDTPAVWVDTSTPDTWSCWEGFLAFDTSGIADSDTISAAVLNVTSGNDFSTTDFTMQARLRDWGTTLTTADWVAGADLSGLTLLATYATSGGFTVNTGYDLSDTAMAANVNKTGSTRMLLCSSRTVGNNAPSGDEYVVFYDADTTGTTSDPKLTVTYTAGSTGYVHSQIVMIR